MPKVTVHGFAKMLVKAGVLTEKRMNNTARIVIDCDAQSGAVTVYVQEFGDAESFEKLAPMLRGMFDEEMFEVK